jgi:hypothetical protein
MRYTDTNQEVISEYWSWRDNEDRILAMAAHSSFGASASLVLLPRMDEKQAKIYDWFAFLGIRATMSLRTIEYAIHTLHHYVAICVVPALITEMEKDEFIIELYAHANSGKLILNKLYTWVHDNQNSPELACP